MTNFNRVNLIAVLNQSQTHILMCLRTKNPYKGLYNFVGGKLYLGEDSLDGAYRELFEETNINRDDISIKPLFTTHYQDDLLSLEVFSAILKHDVDLIEEANPLKWIRLDEDFSSNQFARNGNVQHIIECIKFRYMNQD